MRGARWVVWWKGALVVGAYGGGRLIGNRRAPCSASPFSLDVLLYLSPCLHDPSTTFSSFSTRLTPELTARMYLRTPRLSVPPLRRRDA